MENQLAAQKADHQRYTRENEELTKRLKKFVERLDNDKSDLFQQLLEEKRSDTHTHGCIHWFIGHCEGCTIISDHFSGSSAALVQSVYLCIWTIHC